MWKLFLVGCGPRAEVRTSPSHITSQARCWLLTAGCWLGHLQEFPLESNGDLKEFPSESKRNMKEYPLESKGDP